MKFTSRSVVVDSIFRQSLEAERKNHHHKLELIYNQKKTPIKNHQHTKFKKQLRESKDAAKKTERDFDGEYLSKKSLIQHIIKINERRQEHGVMNPVNMHKSTKEAEQKKILEENMRILHKIQDRKTSVPTFPELKRDVEMYECRRTRLRKVKSKPVF